jgi:hypothetical protein
LPGAVPGATDDGSRENGAVLTLEEEITGLEPLVLDVLSQDTSQGGMPGTVRVSPSARPLRSRRSWISPVSVLCLPDFRSRGVNHQVHH